MKALKDEVQNVLTLEMILSLLLGCNVVSVDDNLGRYRFES